MNLVKKVSAFVIMAVLGFTQVLPAAVFAEEKAVDPVAAESETVNEVHEKKSVNTSIKGMDKTKSFLLYSKKNVVDTIKVTHGMGRKVYLEKKEKGKWVVKKVYKAAKGDKSKEIKIDYTSLCKSAKAESYRVRIPSKTVSKTVDGENSTTKKITVYKAKIKKAKVIGEKFAWPIPGRKHISSGFGGRHCPFHGLEFHAGVDIPARKGTKVRAAADGVVVKAGRVRSFGKRVIIKHGNKKTTTWYNHLSSIKVKKGQKIRKGQVIGGVGSTGDATGNHLDFRIFINGKAKNPAKYAKR